MRCTSDFVVYIRHGNGPMPKLVYLVHLLPIYTPAVYYPSPLPFFLLLIY